VSVPARLCRTNHDGRGVSGDGRGCMAVLREHMSDGLSEWQVRVFLPLWFVCERTRRCEDQLQCVAHLPHGVGRRTGTGALSVTRIDIAATTFMLASDGSGGGHGIRRVELSGGKDVCQSIHMHKVCVIVVSARNLLAVLLTLLTKCPVRVPNRTEAQ
jgi:hypothetical protein